LLVSRLRRIPAFRVRQDRRQHGELLPRKTARAGPEIMPREAKPFMRKMLEQAEIDRTLLDDIVARYNERIQSLRARESRVKGFASRGLMVRLTLRAREGNHRVKGFASRGLVHFR